MTTYAEKRSFLRMPIDCTLTYRIFGELETYKGYVVNLSSHGILFTTQLEIEVGTELDILLTPSNSSTEPMQAHVVVTRLKTISPVFELACEMIGDH